MHLPTHPSPRKEFTCARYSVVTYHEVMSSEQSQNLSAAYEHWRVPRSLIEEIETSGYVSLAQFNRLLTLIEPHTATDRHRISPTEFLGAGLDTHALPRSFDWRWGSLERVLQEFLPTGVMTMLPQFWQTEPAIFFACKSAQTPLFTIQPDNLAVAARAIDLGGVDTIIAPYEVAKNFISYLTQYGDTLPRHWILIRSTPTQVNDTAMFPTSCAVVNEYHLFPGIPAMVQCAGQARARSNFFHLSDDFILSNEDDSSLLTSKEKETMPVFRLQMSCAAREEAVCDQCGKATYSLC